MRSIWLALALFLGASPCWALPELVVDTATGNVLLAREADASWHPASLTKMMTAYVALRSIRDGSATWSTPIVISETAARAAPSKMGFKPGSSVTLSEALPMMLVKSANDVAAAIAENLAGGSDAFVAQMNREAQWLGMSATHWSNANGLHDPTQVTTACDLAILSLALLRDFPEAARLFGLEAIRYDEVVYRNHNALLRRVEGADGMKTGFVCASGFNIVASATRSGHRVLAIVLGRRTARERDARASELIEQAFSGKLRPVALSSAPSQPMVARDMRGPVCRGHRDIEEGDDSPGRPLPLKTTPAAAAAGVQKSSPIVAPASEPEPAPQAKAPRRF